MTTPIAITGATGNLGGRIARPRPRRAQSTLARPRSGSCPYLDGATAVPGSYSDSAAPCDALAGIDTTLMVSASVSPTASISTAASSSPLLLPGSSTWSNSHSSAALPDATFTLARDHYATEKHIKAPGMAYTFLRDNLYADFFPEMIGQDNVLRGPAGDGRVAAVARDDIADVAASVLTDPAAHVGRTLGPHGA